MELDLDLSNVLFITTANTLNMPQPLLDRMEIIRLSGYTEDEKLEIAKRHLMGRQIKDHGLKDGELTVTDDAIRGIIRNLRFPWASAFRAGRWPPSMVSKRTSNGNRRCIPR